MNLMNFLHGGIERMKASESDRMAERQRKEWMSALLADETRAWMNLGRVDRAALRGVLGLLALAGFCHLHDGHDQDAPDMRVIRGAISAGEQCGLAGSVITREAAQAFAVAASRAREIFQTASLAAIKATAMTIDRKLLQGGPSSPRWHQNRI
jgi:hypothetical protein